VAYSNVLTVEVLPKEKFNVKIYAFFYDRFGMPREIPVEIKICIVHPEIGYRCFSTKTPFETSLKGGYIVEVSVPEYWWGYRFVMWSDGVTDKYRRFTVTSDVELGAEYTPI